MSEEKLYAVKNDEGEYWDFREQGKFWKLSSVFCSTIDSKKQAELVADEHGGHVVTFVEEPEKVVLTNEQAEIVDDAHGHVLPACYISEQPEDEELLMKAYVNGYILKKDTKYNVKVPKEWSGDDKHYWTKGQDGALTWAWLINKDYMIPTQQFTITEIEHYGLQDCEKVEVTDDKQ